MSPETTTTDKLAALITAKQQVLEILVQLSRRQLDLIGAGDMTTLMKLLAGKHTVMTHLQLIEGELAPFRDQDPDQRVWNSIGERVACQTRARHCNALLSDAMEMEKKAEAAMLERRQTSAAALSAIQAGVNAKAAYDSFPPTALASLHVEG